VEYERFDEIFASIVTEAEIRKVIKRLLKRSKAGNVLAIHELLHMAIEVEHMDRPIPSKG
jgi:hypothetical protein